MNKYTQIKENDYENYILNKLKLEYDNVWLFKNTPEKILQNTKLYQLILSKLFSNMCIAFGLFDKKYHLILSKLFSKNDIAFRLFDNIFQFILSTSMQYKNDIKLYWRWNK